MLKIGQPSISDYNNFKCGEIYCISPSVYNVTCCLCSTEMHLEQFTIHFQMQHLTLAEESIFLDELKGKHESKLSNDINVVDNVTNQAGDEEDDPIKEEEVQVIRQIKDEYLLVSQADQCIAKNTSENDNVCLDLEGDVEDDPIKEEEVQVIRQIKDEYLLVSQADQCIAKNTLENDNVCLDFETYPVKQEDNINDVDRNWSMEKKLSESESDRDKTNIPVDELPYPCLICKRSYSSKRSLQMHRYRVHNPDKPSKKSKLTKEEHKCDVCNKICRSARELRGHKWQHTGIFCDICGKTFKQTGNLNKHKIRHTGIKSYKCKDCDKKFFTDRELQSHLICHTGTMPLICEICGKPCRDIGILKIHMRRHTGERPAKCEICGKSFFTGRDRNLHALTHSSERPFKCDICDSTFRSKKSLRIHKLIHSKDRKHVCNICGKGYTHTGGFNTHMRTHRATETPTTFIPVIANQNTTTNTTDIFKTEMII